MKLYDITMPMNPALPAWPGDVPYSFSLSWRMSEGASVNVGAIRTSVHSGTHADAPYHFRSDGKTIDQLDLQAFAGPAVVVDVSGRQQIRSEDLLQSDFSATPRLLLKSGSWNDHSRFPERITTLAPGVATELQKRGVILIGVDVPSVDQIDSKDLPIHHELGRAGIVILENLDLRDVPAGEYELIAFPLRLVGADGAPVRAVLRSR